MGLPSEWLKLSPGPRKLAENERWNVFLSYRSVSRPWVLTLYDVLRERGHTVFLDQCVLKAGDELTRRLEEALDLSQAGVLVWSDTTRDSDWVYREYQAMEGMAKSKKGFEFVPIRLDHSTLPRFASNRIFLDFSSYPDGPNGGELLRLLHAIVGEPLSDEAARFANAQDEEARDTAARIETAIRNKAPDRIIQLFEEDGLPWKTSAALGCKAAEALIRLRRYDDALRILEDLEQRFGKAVRPKHLHALALARRGEGGDLARAQEILGVLYQLGERDPETLGIYGRTWMDRYADSNDPGDLAQSRDLYAEAFEGAQDDYYTGINAAAKSVFLGTEEDLERATEYAARVQEIVGTEPVKDDYWMSATVAEVALIQRKFSEAARLYGAAVATARSEVGSHESSWLQAARLMEKLKPAPEERAAVRKAFAHLPHPDRA